MQTSTHNQRLMHEAIGDADGERAMAHGNLRAIAAALFILLLGIALAVANDVEISKLAAATSDGYTPPVPASFVPQTAATPPEAGAPQAEPAKKEPEGNVVDMTY
jgi:hypothetical protein